MLMFLKEVIKLKINNPLSNIVKLKHNAIDGIFKDILYIFSLSNDYSIYKLEKQININIYVKRIKELMYFQIINLFCLDIIIYNFMKR